MAATTPTSFGKLSSEFIQYYGDFNEHYNEKVSSFDVNSPQNQCFLTFGISGAGKSTLIARLISKLPPADFFDQINRPSLGNKVKIIEIEDVKIGMSALSTTIVPKGYKIGSRMLVCDMPGFKDALDDRRIYINILQKCMLTRVSRGKFLVVVDMQKVFDDNKFSTLIDDYAKSIQEVVQNDFEAAVENMFFIITHNEERQTTSREVRMRALEGAYELRSNRVGSLFLARMVDHHIILDYGHDTAETIRERLEELIALHTQNMGEGVVSWRIDKLAIGENQLNLNCVQEVNVLKKASETSKVDVTSITEKFIQLKADSLRLLQEKKNACAATERSIQLAEGELRETELKLNNLPGKVKLMELDLQSLGAELEHQQALSVYFESGVSELESISMRLDYSREKPRMTSVTTVDHVLKFDLPLLDSKKQKIVIIEASCRKAFMDVVSDGTSMLPQDLSVLDTIDAPWVLYSNAAHRNYCDAKIGPENEKQRARGVTPVAVKHKEAMLMITYYITEMCVSTDYRLLKAGLSKKTKELKARMVKIESELSYLKSSRPGVEKKVCEVQSMLNTLEVERNNQKQSLSDGAVTIRHTIDKMIDELSSIKNTSQALIDDGSVPKLQKISEIFDENDMTYDWKPELEVLTKQSRDIMDDVGKKVLEIQSWSDEHILRLDDLITA